MNKSELVQRIGYYVCDGCDGDRDCGLEVDECGRIADAVDVLNVFLKESYNKTKMEGRE